jgi:hypothetical protein
MITKKQWKFNRFKCTQAKAYDVELIFRKIWTLVSYFLKSYAFIMNLSLNHILKRKRIEKIQG